MDEQTVGVYDQQAARMAAAQRAISDTQVHQLMLKYFHKGGPTADIGCGSGRDVAWLNKGGYAAVGFEPSAGMRVQALAAYPDIDVRPASLPELREVADGQFANVLCNAVLMHLPGAQLPLALANLARLLRSGGRLAISYRNGLVPNAREDDGRLFSPIDAQELVEIFARAGLRQLAVAEQPETERPGIVWRAVVAEKSG